MSRMMCRFAAIAVCLSAIVVVGATTGGKPVKTNADWPQWRGPDRDGKSSDTGLMASWEKEPPELAWTAKDIGVGFSGVSVQGARIFTMGEQHGDQFVIALNRADGKQIWSQKIGIGGDNAGFRGPRCTPAADGRFVYAMGSDSDLACLNAANGKIIWHHNLQTDFGGRMMTVWGYSESPLVDGDRVICTPGGNDATIIALNKLNGKLIWRCAVPNLGTKGADGAGYSSAVVSNGAGVRQYVQLLGRGLAGVRAKDGKFLWGYNKVANEVANVPTPIVHDDYVFDSTGYQTGAALLKLSKSGDGVKADEVYFLDHTKLQNHHGGMVLVGDYLYGGHGHNAGAPICVEFLTGKVKWKQNRGPGRGSAAVSYADGKLYFRYQDGTMALIDCTPDGYKPLGTFKIPDVKAPSWPHPVIVGGRLYLREQDHLLCYKLN